MVNTKRTILSPFTKEYRVLATISGIRQFLEDSLSFRDVRLTIQNQIENDATDECIVYHFGIKFISLLIDCCFEIFLIKWIELINYININRIEIPESNCEWYRDIKKYQKHRLQSIYNLVIILNNFLLNL